MTNPDEGTPAKPADIAYSAPDQRELIRERDEWFYSLALPRKQEKLFELEVLLKGLDRFFSIANLPISDKDQIVKRDFAVELQIIRRAVSRVIKLAQGLLTEADNQALQFQNYVSNRLLNDYQRAQRIERAVFQRTPEESLYVLCQSFINFQEILAAITEAPQNSYFLFYHLEQIIGREIASNRFFNPFKAAGFSPHYDAIKSPRFTRIVRGIEDPSLKRHLSVIFLMIFKLLRYLGFVNPEEREGDRLKDALLIFALVHSETLLLVDLLERQLPPLVRSIDGLPDETRLALLNHLDALAYQLAIEIRKIYELELKDAALQQELNVLRVGISRSCGILTNIYQQGIVHLGQAFDPILQGREVFPDFVSRLEESLKLRRDIWLFHQVIENLERVIEQSRPRNETIPVIEAVKTLRNFIFYYQNISFQFVRCYDRESFQRFFEQTDQFIVADIEKPDSLEAFKHNLHRFKMFLETTLASINNRAELRELPFGKEEGERLLAQFLG
jgi:DNA-binding transcriptional ArsR family regulator